MPSILPYFEPVTTCSGCGYARAARSVVTVPLGGLPKFGGLETAPELVPHMQLAVQVLVYGDGERRLVSSIRAQLFPVYVRTVLSDC